MGMFDFYRPAPPLPCPQGLGWLTTGQGRDGPRRLLVFEEGHAAPVGQMAGPTFVMALDDLRAFRLPPRFTFAAHCDEGDEVFDLTGGCDEAGVWFWTVLGSFPEAPLVRGSRDGAWLSCPVCANIWQPEGTRAVVVCPDCHALVIDPVRWDERPEVRPGPAT